MPVWNIPLAAEGIQADPGSASISRVDPADKNFSAIVRIDPNWPYLNVWQDARTKQELPGQQLYGDGTFLNCPFVNLSDGLAETFGVDYADTQVIGRAESYKTFMGTTNREVQLSFWFWSQDGDPQAEVVAPARWLESLKSPVIDTVSKLSHAPPPVLIQIGQLLIARCVVTDATLTWQAPFEPRTLLPHGVEVQVTFTVVRRWQGSAQGVTSVDRGNIFVSLAG